jgi:hypothetical protein
MSAAGFVLAAGGIVAANEVLFMPAQGQGSPVANFNWRLVPATAILAITLSGFEKFAPQFAEMLGVMVLLTVLIAPVGKTPPPLTNIANVLSHPQESVATHKAG